VGRRLPHLLAQSALSSAFMVKTQSEKIGFDLGPDLTIIGSSNLNTMLKIEF
jgi:hypothetical protein